MRISVFIIFFLLTLTGFSQHGEIGLLHTINQNEHPRWDRTMKQVSKSAYFVLPAVVVIPFAQGFSQKDKALQRSSIKSAICIGLASLCTTGLKYTIRRDRPAVKYPTLIVQRDHADRFSFPSGHTTGAFAAATALTLTYKSWYVGVPAYLYAGLVGYSRMRLGMHYPTDVLGGMIIGIGTGLLTWKLDQVMNR